MLDKELHFMLLRGFQNSNRLIMREANKLCLFLGQPKILEYLSEHDGAKAIDIACGCVLDKSTVASLLLRMEKMDLIRREANEFDGRAHDVFLTELGKEKAKQVKNICQDVDKCAMRGISKEEQGKFLDTLNKVIENLSEEHNSR